MEEYFGCLLEAQRGDNIVRELSRIRAALYPTLYEHITLVMRQVEKMSRSLRELYHLYPACIPRIPMLTYYLEIILPCLAKTLLDMVHCVCNRDLVPAAQWWTMYDHFYDEARTSLAARFAIYNDYLIQLVQLMSRCIGPAPS